MLNESSLLLEKQIYLMILNWNLTSLSFCDLPVTFTYRDWNELALRWWNHLSHSNHIFQDEKKKPREHKSQMTLILKPISGQCSLSLPFDLRTAENLWLFTVPLVWESEHWPEMDWLIEKGNQKKNQRACNMG